jgi:hypothetical protein
MELAEISWPNGGEIDESSLHMDERFSKFDGCFAFVDGLSFDVQEPGNRLVENDHHNGRKRKISKCHLHIVYAHTYVCCCQHN